MDAFYLAVEENSLCGGDGLAASLLLNGGILAAPAPHLFSFLP